MIRLAARFAAAGGRESAIRLVLTALGVALGTTVLLVSAAVDPAIRAQQERVAWMHTGRSAAETEGAGDPLRWRLVEDRVDGRELTLLRVAATGPGSPVPLGLDRVPAPGELHVSPALARLLERLPPDRLADRFAEPPSGRISEDFLAGPDHLVAVLGTPLDQMRHPFGFDVHRIRTEPAPRQFSDVLRVVIALVAVGVLLPILVFVTTSTRLGAARREQRLAALRLAGGTPRQIAAVAVVESGAAAAVGALVGAAGFALVRPAVAAIELDGHTPFTADVQAPFPVLAAVLVLVLLLAMAASAVSLRRLAISPLGVARRARRPRPTARRLLPLGLGAVGYAASLGVAIGQSSNWYLVPVMGSFALMIYGIVVAGPWLTLLAAGLLARIGRRPSTLLAARRLEDDPAGGFRAVSGLVVAVFVASVFSGATPALLAENQADRNGLRGGDTMVAATLHGTTPAAAVAAVVATGRPGAVVHVPSTSPGPPRFVAACDDLEVLRLEGSCPAGGTGWLAPMVADRTVRPAPFSPGDLAAMPVVAVVVETDGTLVGTDRARTTLQRVLPGVEADTGQEDADSANRRIEQLERLSTLVLAVTLIVAGCGLAVGVAGGIVERKRPFGLLRLSGVALADLRLVALLEAAAPLLLIATASALTGLATSALIVAITVEAPWSPPARGYWAGLGGGLALAVAVSAGTLPLLGRVTAPSAVRFE